VRGQSLLADECTFDAGLALRRPYGELHIGKFNFQQSSHFDPTVEICPRSAGEALTLNGSLADLKRSFNAFQKVTNNQFRDGITPMASSLPFRDNKTLASIKLSIAGSISCIETSAPDREPS